LVRADKVHAKKQGAFIFTEVSLFIARYINPDKMTFFCCSTLNLQLQQEDLLQRTQGYLRPEVSGERPLKAGVRYYVALRNGPQGPYFGQSNLKAP
jgi:hypothetical protein